MSNELWRGLADGALGVHVALVAFVVLGQVWIVVGGMLGVQSVRSWRFRGVHLALIVGIAGQTWLGQTCPLTTLEQILRSQGGEAGYRESFTEHWLAPLIFFDAPPWVFSALHSVMAGCVVATWVWVRPHWPRRTEAHRDHVETATR
jgi:hypothetical protein